VAQGGATREALTRETIIGFNILRPPFDLILRYGQIASQLHEQRETLCRKNEILRITRDVLLPKLVSGDVSLENIQIEAAAQPV
jgi:type I restriction enzyme S subunit